MSEVKTRVEWRDVESTKTEAVFDIRVQESRVCADDDSSSSPWTITFDPAQVQAVAPHMVIQSSDHLVIQLDPLVGSLLNEVKKLRLEVAQCKCR